MIMKWGMEEMKEKRFSSIMVYVGCLINSRFLRRHHEGQQRILISLQKFSIYFHVIERDFPMFDKETSQKGFKPHIDPSQSDVSF